MCSQTWEPPFGDFHSHTEHFIQVIRIVLTVSKCFSALRTIPGQRLMFLSAFLQNPTHAKNKHDCFSLSLIALRLKFDTLCLSLTSVAVCVTCGRTKISTIKPVWWGPPWSLDSSSWCWRSARLFLGCSASPAFWPPSLGLGRDGVDGNEQSRLGGRDFYSSSLTAELAFSCSNQFPRSVLILVSMLSRSPALSVHFNILHSYVVLTFLCLQGYCLLELFWIL